LGGKFVDLSLDKTLIGFLLLLMLMMLLFPILATTAICAGLALILWDSAAFAVVPPLQMRVMSVAHDALGLASSVNMGSFNLGNALGAITGATVLNMGLSYTAVSFSGAGLSLVALLLVLIQIKLVAHKAVDYQPC
jgi:DHA1 family inner membrane transport protein